MGSDAPQNSALTLPICSSPRPKALVSCNSEELAVHLLLLKEGARWQPEPGFVVWGTPPFSLLRKCILRKCSSQNTSSLLPSPNVGYLSLTAARGGGGVGRSYSARLTDQETEAQRGMMLAPGHTASQRTGLQSESHPLVCSRGDLVFNPNSFLAV